MSVSVLAARPSGGKLLTDTASVNAWDAWLDTNIRIGIDFGIIDVSEKARYWAEMDRGISASGAGVCSDRESLVSAMDNWNGAIASFGNLFNLLMYCISNSTFAVPTAELAYDDDLGVWRLREYHSNLWLVNSSGHFPYYDPISNSGGGGGFSDGIGQWLPYDQAIASNTALWHTVIGADLSAYAESWPDRNSRITESEDYFYLVWNDPEQHRKAYVLCDDYGYPYYIPKPKQTAVTTPNNYFTQPGDSYVDDSTNVNVYDQGSAFLDSILDVENGILNVGGEAYYVDEINYDDSTKTYYVDSHDSYTWNSTTNNYVTNNYRWEIQYNIDYTSVTYIGQTEEYEEEYKYYYELPDGRSSADLTREDLEQLSVVFHDVMNYAHTADDLDLRALYHFDGNTEDSSYWSYMRHGFNWETGASLTYMDEGTFGGSLYLDETEHKFTITLPGNDLAGDWTLQFRYYQSHTETPVSDSWISFGGNNIFGFTGDEYIIWNGAKIADTSVGTWNEICIERKVTDIPRISFYINGLCYQIFGYYEYLSPEITFHFGSDQQTFKKIDELRFTKRALHEYWENYSPTVVPYDTNLSLVLPDRGTAIADEVVTYEKSANNLLTPAGLDTFDVSLNTELTNFECWPASYNFNGGYPAPVNGVHLFTNSSYSWGSVDDEGVCWYYTRASSPVVLKDTTGPNGWECTLRELGAPLFLPVYITYNDHLNDRPPPDSQRVFGEAGKTYTLSVLLSDGSYSEITFDYDLNILSSNFGGSNVRLSREYIGTQGYAYDQWSEYYYHAYIYYCGIAIYPANGSKLDIVHVELVEGSSHQFTVDVDYAIYTMDQLSNSPVLAVRSNRPITTYQIGGVRPSYPEKGQVYALVENNRITSLQQYTGFVWEAVDGRIWTGSRWIPYSSFDVKTLQDFWDVEGTTDDDYFYSESGFWAWFQRQWKIFMEKIDAMINYLKSGDGGSVDLEEDQLLEKEEYDGIVGLLFDCYHFVSGFFSDFVVGSVGNLITDLDDTESQYFGIFKLGGG